MAGTRTKSTPRSSPVREADFVPASTPASRRSEKSPTSIAAASASPPLIAVGSPLSLVAALPTAELPPSSPVLRHPRAFPDERLPPDPEYSKRASSDGGGEQGDCWAALPLATADGLLSSFASNAQSDSLCTPPWNKNTASSGPETTGEASFLPAPLPPPPLLLVDRLSPSSSSLSPPRSRPELFSSAELEALPPHPESVLASSPSSSTSWRNGEERKGRTGTHVAGIVSPTTVDRCFERA